MNPERTDLVAVLKNTRLLSILSQPELPMLAQRTVRMLFSSGELVFSEGAPKALTVVGMRLRRLVTIIEELSITTIRQHLVSTLVRLAQNEGLHIARGVKLTLPVGHQEMANQLGTVPALISGNLKRLEAEGFLEVD